MSKKMWIICIAIVMLCIIIDVVLFIKTGRLPSIIIPYQPIQPIVPPIIQQMLAAG